MDENQGAANWTETAGGGKLGENHGWTSGASGKKLRAVKWNVGELAMNCLASDSRRQVCIDYNGTPNFAVSRVIFRDKPESRTAVGAM